MMHKAWSSIEQVPYCFSRSSVKFQGHTALKIVEFDPKWAFPDCNSSLNSPMAMKCCTKLETAKERCPIVFQGHPSNFKVTRYKTSPILTQIGRFRTIGQSQLSNPSDLPCFLFHYLFICTYILDSVSCLMEGRMTGFDGWNDGKLIVLWMGCWMIREIWHVDVILINLTRIIRNMMNTSCNQHGIQWTVKSLTRRTKCPNLNVSRLVLQLSLPNTLKPGVKPIMKT